ncbi:MAG: hypothetical protein IJ397_00190 [Lachnospiraceae bacterium]|nr:hypothetical protein [Lachnospiraceae bacterium]
MKRKVLNAILLMSLMAIMFVGCSNKDAVKEEEVSSETASVAEESINLEEVGEENSEALSEEIGEETVEVDYSANTIIALCDELAEKYVYDDPEYIKSLVIAANLDYITEEDLITILTTWGYTMEDLAVIYEEGIESTADAYAITNWHMEGSAIEFNDEVNYANRVLFQDVTLNIEDRLLAIQFDEYAIASNGDKFGEFWSEEPKTSFEALLSSVSDTLRYGDMWVTPYADYIQENVN